MTARSSDEGALTAKLPGMSSGAQGRKLIDLFAKVLRDPTGAISCFIIIALILIAISAPWIAPLRANKNICRDLPGSESGPPVWY